MRLVRDNLTKEDLSRRFRERFDDYLRFFINGYEIDLFTPVKVLAQIDNGLWDLLEVINKYNETNANFYNNTLFISEDEETNNYYYNIFKEKHKEFIDLVKSRSN